MCIRLATVQDVRDIRALYRILFRDMAALQPNYWQEGEQGEQFLVDTIRNPESDIFVAESKSATGLVGFVVVKEQHTLPYTCIRPHHYAYLMDMVVAPDHRNCHLGRRFIDQIKLWAKERKLDYVELNVLEENIARALYERMGFGTAVHTMRCELGTLGDLFIVKPQQWGLRGDPYLWEDMACALGAIPLPCSEEDFCRLVQAEFRRLTGWEFGAQEKIIRPERYRNGGTGLSEGCISTEFWQAKALPMLCERLRAENGKQEG